MVASHWEKSGRSAQTAWHCFRLIGGQNIDFVPAVVLVTALAHFFSGGADFRRWAFSCLSFGKLIHEVGRAFREQRVLTRMHVRWKDELGPACLQTVPNVATIVLGLQAESACFSVGSAGNTLAGIRHFLFI